MTTSALDSYLGWEKPTHRRGCKSPAWDVTFRVEEKQYERSYYGDERPKHACADEDCGHGSTFDKLVVRIVCLSCGVAQVSTGERTERTGETLTSTRHLGYGLPPRRVAGLLLWPGNPWLRTGWGDTDEPHDFVVTQLGVTEVTEAAVLGEIALGQGKLRGRVWTTLAVPDPKGQYGYASQMRFAECNDGRGRGGSPLRTVTAAARWIAARTAEAETTAAGAVAGVSA
ncbi:hypothetical protein ACIPEL_15215 [Streptomyces griseoviridis]